MPVDPDPDPAGRLARDRWSAAHGGVDPDASRWISGWLALVHRLARPLAARRVPPSLITAAGLIASALVPLVAGAPGAWPIAAAVLAVAAGLLDGMDGAVARMNGTDTAWGAVLDELVDRISDLLLLSALWVLGAPAWACLAAGALTLLLESLRSSARGGGMVGVGVITVWERPSRIIVVMTVGVLCGLVRIVQDAVDLPDGAVEVLAGVGAVVAAVLAAWSTVHLALVVRRSLGVRKAPRDR
ncbi:CDP-alcohol phosphatidyltransferase family protein [Aeromicrobium chenweiae]|uniref:CDP-alcohol phosphatidyltransferase family protein n=1 Tax=Aeromicrobium chenweiae TaxID=2079793 RepID=A0A2S0WI17_9ACTN|nr:CDP-alcohol phosphatidyltransferase family protein [Aeromicrobium chenweiae]AWB90932.1 CDP-alcohol phosphatidyltransferase family protein [Aeromicrobium chenweiae]TGN32152.1 CDP-alcohol phosphatidyltransferase family protein [Aeromicrobium chenweiae]